MQKRANLARAASRFVVTALSLACLLVQPPHSTEPSLTDASHLSSEVAVPVATKIAVKASRFPEG
jgi:hypothetical protein